MWSTCDRRNYLYLVMHILFSIRFSYSFLPSVFIGVYFSIINMDALVLDYVMNDSDDESDSDNDVGPMRRRLVDRLNPLDGLNDQQIYSRYRFTSAVVLELTQLITNDIGRSTRRSNALTPLKRTCIVLR